MVHFLFYLYVYIGLEKDFKVWKDGLVKNVFPALIGEATMNEITTAMGTDSALSEESSCECRERRKEECCKEKPSKQVKTFIAEFVLIINYHKEPLTYMYTMYEPIALNV